MRREYRVSEFDGKISMLTEYYKFHNDVPRVVELGVEKIMGRYYDKRRGIDYRKIKRVPFQGNSERNRVLRCLYAQSMLNVYKEYERVINVDESWIP